MTLYQKIPTVSARVHPLMIGAALGVIVLSLISTAAIIGWLPAQQHTLANAETAMNASVPAAGFAKVSAPVAADAAQAPSPKTPRKTPARITNA
ncbi:hypothetical protein [Pseudoduganella rhizocola]|uniref:hypothetical protein n=1 Tax=Pseudoduganella rhizocola TaxID=3382643 RepID=UPI0038B433EF